MTPTPATPNKPPRTCRSWERRKEHRPSELLEAATEVFVTRGYAAARLDDIAARAGVSKGTLYLYYAGKEELFKAVVRVKFVPIINEFQARIEQATGSSEALLTEILESWWCCFSQPKLSGIIKLIISEAGNFPEIARFFNDEVSQIGKQSTRSLLERGIERNEFRAVEDLETASHLIISPMVMKLVWHHSVGACVGDCIDPENFIRQHTKLVLMMLRKPDADQT
ncbi:MAG: TetR/AcrR family transcriptional regulator [Lautropia sp.]|nr:TetR/AcrR family transcriptional regulator [Lautropia sp.]